MYISKAFEFRLQQMTVVFFELGCGGDLSISSFDLWHLVQRGLVSGRVYVHRSIS